MKQKLSQLAAPALAGVVREKNVRGAIAEIMNCMYDGATMIDLHLSCLEATDVESLKNIITSTKLPVLALNYNSTYTWESADFSEEERAKSLLRAVGAGAAGVDMQGYTFHLPSKSNFCGEDRYSFTKGNPKEIVTDEAIISKQCELIDKVHAMGAEVLLSCHPGIPMNSTQVVELAQFLEKRNPDIIKIVTKAETEDDLAECIRAMLLLKKEVKTPVSYHTNGSAGTLSRIINPLLGGKIAFCVDHYNEASTMEQIDLRTAASIVENMKKIMGD
ncbi:MAG: type I 3-dehydroquinate dehydratase [Ruminococcaceae bacterium]|nr:type I 3-dehydroquinate dehydratase [Oscillospiraceae bacterium]